MVEMPPTLQIGSACRDSAIAVVDTSHDQHNRSTDQQDDDVFFFEPYQG